MQKDPVFCPRSCFDQGHGNLLGGDGQLPEPLAGGPVDGVGVAGFHNSRSVGKDDLIVVGVYNSFNSVSCRS